MVALVPASSTLPAFILSGRRGPPRQFQPSRVMFAGLCIIVIASAHRVCGAGLCRSRMILGFSFLIACGGALNDPSWQASVGDIVERHDVPSAVALLSVVQHCPEWAWVGGIIVASFGLVMALAVTLAPTSSIAMAAVALA
ncbi:MFS transporter [Mesorhizobium sp. M0037]